MLALVIDVGGSRELVGLRCPLWVLSVPVSRVQSPLQCWPSGSCPATEGLCEVKVGTQGRGCVLVASHLSMDVPLLPLQGRLWKNIPRSNGDEEEQRDMAWEMTSHRHLVLKADSEHEGS